jgi:putative membrane protein
VAIVLAIRYLTTGKVSPSERAQSDPLKILQERYARGEIDTEEYEERKKALQSGT